MTGGGIVWIEGLIGAGKTTCATRIAEALDFEVAPEPVHEHGYLELFYQEPEKWAFPMQMDMLFSRWLLHKLATYQAACGRGMLMDRGMPGDMVFAELQHELGNFNDLQWRTYMKMYNGLMLSGPELPRLLVYLDVTPGNALERARQRARQAEKDLPLWYLEKLAEVYERLLSRLSSGHHRWGHGMKVCRVDWNEPHQGIDGILDAIRDCAVDAAEAVRA